MSIIKVEGTMDSGMTQTASVNTFVMGNLIRLKKLCTSDSLLIKDEFIWPQPDPRIVDYFLCRYLKLTGRDPELIKFTRYINPRNYISVIRFLDWIDFKTSKGLMDPGLEYLFPYSGHTQLDKVFREFMGQSRHPIFKKRLECDIYYQGRNLCHK